MKTIKDVLPIVLGLPDPTGWGEDVTEVGDGAYEVPWLTDGNSLHLRFTAEEEAVTVAAMLPDREWFSFKLTIPDAGGYEPARIYRFKRDDEGGLAATDVDPGLKAVAEPLRDVFRRLVARPDDAGRLGMPWDWSGFTAWLRGAKDARAPFMVPRCELMYGLQAGGTRGKAAFWEAVSREAMFSQKVLTDQVRTMRAKYWLDADTRRGGDISVIEPPTEGPQDLAETRALILAYLAGQGHYCHAVEGDLIVYDQIPPRAKCTIGPVAAGKLAVLSRRADPAELWFEGGNGAVTLLDDGIPVDDGGADCLVAYTKAKGNRKQRVLMSKAYARQHPMVSLSHVKLHLKELWLGGERYDWEALQDEGLRSSLSSRFLDQRLRGLVEFGIGYGNHKLDTDRDGTHIVRRQVDGQGVVTKASLEVVEVEPGVQAVEIQLDVRIRRHHDWSGKVLFADGSKGTYSLVSPTAMPSTLVDKEPDPQRTYRKEGHRWRLFADVSVDGTKHFANGKPGKCHAWIDGLARTWATRSGGAAFVWGDVPEFARADTLAEAIELGNTQFDDDLSVDDVLRTTLVDGSEQAGVWLYSRVLPDPHTRRSVEAQGKVASSQLALELTMGEAVQKAVLRRVREGMPQVLDWLHALRQDHKVAWEDGVPYVDGVRPVLVRRTLRRVCDDTNLILAEEAQTLGYERDEAFNWLKGIPAEVPDLGFQDTVLDPLAAVQGLLILLPRHRSRKGSLELPDTATFTGRSGSLYLPPSVMERLLHDVTPAGRTAEGHDALRLSYVLQALAEVADKGLWPPKPTGKGDRQRKLAEAFYHPEEIDAVFPRRFCGVSDKVVRNRVLSLFGYPEGDRPATAGHLTRLAADGIYDAANPQLRAWRRVVHLMDGLDADSLYLAPAWLEECRRREQAAMEEHGLSLAEAREWCLRHYPAHNWVGQRLLARRWPQEEAIGLLCLTVHTASPELELPYGFHPVMSTSIVVCTRADCDGDLMEFLTPSAFGLTEDEAMEQAPSVTLGDEWVAAMAAHTDPPWTADEWLATWVPYCTDEDGHPLHPGWDLRPEKAPLEAGITGMYRKVQIGLAEGGVTFPVSLGLRTKPEDSHVLDGLYCACRLLGELAIDKYNGLTQFSLFGLSSQLQQGTLADGWLEVLAAQSDQPTEELKLREARKALAALRMVAGMATEGKDGVTRNLVLRGMRDSLPLGIGLVKQHMERGGDRFIRTVVSQSPGRLAERLMTVLDRGGEVTLAQRHADAYVEHLAELSQLVVA